ncbi:NAD-dependent deacetylase [Comamonas sp. JUb58]|nr:NAD-dependent deacetylase [Comamonas sp. JUb58]
MLDCGGCAHSLLYADRLPFHVLYMSLAPLNTSAALPLADTEIASLRQRLQNARHVLVLTGAGASAESGVPTFRDAQTGYWAQFSPEEMASEAGFLAHPQRVWDWYQYRRDLVRQVQPNAGHVALAQWQARHPDRMTLVTQNVDGLHQRAGSAPVLCLHGNLMDNRWLLPPKACCDVRFTEGDAPPQCPGCGNYLRPGVVWFGEALPLAELQQAQDAAKGCDLMLVIGTSGHVYPAAGLAHIAARGCAHVVVINPEPTELDSVADKCWRLPSAQILPALLA